MNVILIGYRASGKTSIGKRLAGKLWSDFVDVDQEACKRFGGKTIAQIWKELGEPEWRRVEVEVTRELVAKPKQVIALGGGTLMQPGARQAIEQAKETTRVYLKCSTAELHRRISQDTQSAATRPNLTNLGGGIEEIEAVLKVREPVYLAVADKVLDVSHLSIDDAVRWLVEKCL
ncbi:MAG: shikimate kinase [Planctomycetota bacterium]|nr:shikimate kinase [Planctomycetota bacterium]